MPEYLSPGVYIEEVSYRSKTIEGVSTSTTGFVGPTRYGPTDDVPELLTSMADFERIYGSIEQLEFNAEENHNYIAHAVRAYFENGGKRLYVSRVYKPGSGSDGHAEALISADSPVNSIKLKARYPGAAGNMIVTFMFRIGPNILSSDSNYRVLKGASDYDLVWVRDLSSPIQSPPGSGMLYWLERYFDENNNRYSFKLLRPDPQHPGEEKELPLANLMPDIDEVQIVTINITIEPPGKFARPISYENLSFHPKHRAALGKIFSKDPADRSTALYVPLIFEPGIDDAVDIAEILLNQGNYKGINIINTLNIGNSSDAERTFQVLLKNGNDGDRPGATEYEGKDGVSDGVKSGLKALEDIEDISIVAAPGSTYGYKKDYRDAAETILGLLLTHCERMRYRIGVLDSADGQLISEVLRYRGKLDSKYAALYYPWVTILDPVTGDEINLPPSGFVTGIYARSDGEIGVHKAPANEVVNLAIGFELLLNKAQQEVLNPNGINCFRFFEGRGYRLWGARMISSDPEWKYVNLRRHIAYLERSIDKATQWAVFEVNNERLWAKIRSTVEDFLYNEWTSNHLMGESPKEAYFVRCDRSTMTQNDLDNGRLICLIGVALVRPAEFVIFRIGQWTADRRT